MEYNTNNTSNQQKVPFDPGWNDPPTFAYNAQQTQSTRPRNFLNKRVAFPLSSSNAPSSAPPVNLPPVPTHVPIASRVGPTSSDTTKHDTKDLNFDSKDVLQEVKTLLLKFLENSSELGTKGIDIQRKIGVMEEMWLNDRFNKNVQLLMKELACALRDDEPDKADDIHRALMVDHIGAVASWMPGIKQLVHHCKARSELLAIEKE